MRGSACLLVLFGDQLGAKMCNIEPGDRLIHGHGYTFQNKVPRLPAMALCFGQNSKPYPKLMIADASRQSLFEFKQYEMNATAIAVSTTTN